MVQLHVRHASRQTSTGAIGYLHVDICKLKPRNYSTFPFQTLVVCEAIDFPREESGNGYLRLLPMSHKYHLQTQLPDCSDTC